MLSLTYSLGTASVANAATTVTGTGTQWLRALQAGDYFGTHVGYAVRIAAIVSDEELTLAWAWPGATQSGDPYEIAFASDASRATAQTREVVDRLRALDINTQGLFYTYSTLTTDVDPGQGVLRFDNLSLPSVANIYLSDVDANDEGRDVENLLTLQRVGTTLLIRSIESTAYVAFTISAAPVDGTGYHKFTSVDYISHDGSLVNGEALSVSWFGVGEGLNVDAVGVFADRDDHDDEPAGFVYLSVDGDGDTLTTATLFRKNTGTTADWSIGASLAGPPGTDGTDGTDGTNGWTETHTIVSDGTRRVLKVVAYIGGTGTPPTTNLNKYLGAAGYETNIANGVDIRGPVGATGTTGAAGQDGDPGEEGPAGWSPTYGIVPDGSREVLQLAAWVGGGGTPPTANVGDYVGVSGFVSVIGDAVDIRGPQGATGEEGTPGTDPGWLYWFDTATTDSYQGTGLIWADNANLTLATVLYVAKTARTGDSAATFLAELVSSTSPNRKGVIILTLAGGAAQVSYDLVSLVDDTSYVKLTVANGSGVDSFTDSDPISFQFSPTGDAGTAGDGAFNGPDGALSGNIIIFGDSTGQLGEDSNENLAQLVHVALNGADFADKNATLDTLHVLGGDVASASTVNLDTATGGILTVTGTTATSTITLTSGRERWVRASGAWPITVGANLVLNNGGSNYTCAAGDIIHFYADGSTVRGTVFPVSGQQVGIVGLSKGGTGQTTAAASLDALTVKASNVASATTTNIAAATGVLVHVTGTTTITGFGTAAAGVVRLVVFDGALTLTHNGTSLVLPGGVNITTVANDAGVFVSEGSGNWRCIAYTTAKPTTLGGAGLTDATAYVSSRTSMKALDVTKYSAATLTEAGREGTFKWNSGDLSGKIAPLSVTSTGVNSTTDVITSASHGLRTGQAVIPTTTVNGVTASTLYYVIRLDANTFNLASSRANAFSSTKFDLTGTTNFTVKYIPDDLEGIYVIPTGKAADGSQGAWVRVISDDVYNAAWFGLVGDNTTDDTNSLRAALWARGINGVLVIPAGTYKASGAWTIYKTAHSPTQGGLRIDATGAVFSGSGSIIVDSCKRLNIVGLDAPTHVMHLRGCWHARFEGLRIQSYVVGQADGTDFSSCAWNMWIGGYTQAFINHASMSSYCNHNNFWNVNISGQAGQGFAGTTNYGIELNANQDTQSLGFHNCDVSYFNTAIYNIGGGNTAGDVELNFHGCYFDSELPKVAYGRNNVVVNVVNAHAAGKFLYGDGMQPLQGQTKGGMFAKAGQSNMGWAPYGGENLIPNGDFNLPSIANHPISSTGGATITLTGGDGLSRRYIRIEKATSGTVYFSTSYNLPVTGTYTGTVMVRKHSGSSDQQVTVALGGLEYFTHDVGEDWTVIQVSPTDTISSGSPLSLTIGVNAGVDVDVCYVGISLGTAGAPLYLPQSRLAVQENDTGIASSGTAVAVTNVDSVSIARFYYIRKGNLINFAFYITIDPTAAGGTTAGVELPIPSNFTGFTHALGVGVQHGGTTVAYVNADLTNDRLNVNFTAASGTAVSFYCTGQYPIN